MGREKRAALGVRVVWRARVGVVVVGHRPVGVRDVADGVVSCPEKAPEGGQVGRIREHRPHADDRDRLLGGVDGGRGGCAHDVALGSEVDSRLLEGVELGLWPRRELLDPGREPYPLRPERGHAGQHGRPHQEVSPDQDGAPRVPRFEAAAARPLVEGAHRGTAPDLVVELPIRRARVRPLRRLPQVGSEQKRKLVARLGSCALQLRRVSLYEERPAGLPRLFKRRAEVLLLELVAHRGRQGGDAVVGAEQLVEARGADGEERPPREHLHLDPHLEHVRRGGHAHVGRAGRSEELPNGVRGARFEGALVDRSRDDVGRPHRERRRHGCRGRDSPGGTDAHARGVAVLARQLVSERLKCGQEENERAVVRMAAGVGLGGDVIGHRDRRGERGLLRRDGAFSDERVEEGLGWRAKEAPRDFDARDLGHHAVRGDHAPGGVLVDPHHAITDDRQGEVEVGGRADEPNPAGEAQLHHGGLETRVIG